MSQQVSVLDLTFVASSDLRTYQYRMVQLNGGSTTPFGVGVTGEEVTTQVPIGILQNEPNEGEAAVVRVLGTSKLKVDSALGVGSPIGIGTPSGYGTIADADKDMVMGYSLEISSAAGDIIEILIDRCKASI